jgi:DNA helicase-2/ATP-dependent DNA helicase PcrA
MQESRRLCYVGITRAKEKLYMTSAEVRRVYGRTVAYSPSDFLNEIPGNLKEYVGGRGYNSGSRTEANNNSSHGLRSSFGRSVGQGAQNYSAGSSAAAQTQGSGKSVTASEVSLGRKVKHGKFGIGTIVSVAKDGGDTKLTIAFDTQGIKTFILGMTPLELM